MVEIMWLFDSKNLFKNQKVFNKGFFFTIIIAYILHRLPILAYGLIPMQKKIV